jgi:hypothetical protein
MFDLLRTLSLDYATIRWRTVTTVTAWLFF